MEDVEQLILNRKLVVDTLINHPPEQCKNELVGRVGLTRRYCAIGASVHAINKRIDYPQFVTDILGTGWNDELGEPTDLSANKIIDWIIRMNDSRERSLPFIGRCLDLLWKLETRTDTA